MSVPRSARVLVPLTLAVVALVTFTAFPIGGDASPSLTAVAAAPAEATSDPGTADQAAAAADAGAGEDEDGDAATLAAQAQQDLAAQRQQALTAALDGYAAKTSVDFSVAVVDHTTGITYTYGNGADFETASVVKVEILASLLLQAKEAGRTLTANEKTLAEAMIRQSDNDAASALWWMIGDSTGLQKTSTAFGLTETVPGDDGWWGLTTTSVSDQITLLDGIADPDGPLGDSNQYLLDLMGSVVADQSWGVSAAANAGETTQLKNGWMTRTSQGGRWTVNSVGRITGNGTDVTLAIMTRGHTSLDAGTSFVEQIARLTRTDLAW